ncbi:hypothetical protein E2P84_32410 [Burkholderia cepacia]|uniref:RND transporter n=1 Tax=Burkholderia cepacia TaxID=292 RepID=A0AAX2RDP2_BURCE|nr:hypothetical protein E2P84_32410 [Burkholderia cepacia]TEU33070.1 hypothetical protein E3D39_34275 [Burkholderia cepacia]TEU35126.1 hypothetical protein E3D37_37860 [Burkholderia cepacia]TEU40674.1 hypothetical protein E3D38_33995 [Burkholderia cepacia]TEU64241.1 hypothetical protein E3D42_36425 [Burkholderia cepacia]
MSTSPANDRARRAHALRRATGALTVAVLLAGCTLGPDFVPPPAPRVARFVPPDDPGAAAAGLGTVVRGWINHRTLADALRLNEDELPILAQTVGYRTGSAPSHA